MYDGEGGTIRDIALTAQFYSFYAAPPVDLRMPTSQATSSACPKASCGQ
ncbi:hypothetical protein GCM10025794_37430 [Massilia kyonggiensis]